MFVTTLDVWEKAHPIEVDGRAALAIPYEKPGTGGEGEPEIGIAALALATGELLDSIRLREGTAAELTVQIQSTDAGEVLLDIIDWSAHSADAMLVDFAVGKPVWTRTGQATVAMVGDTVLLAGAFWRFPEDGGTTVTAVACADGETLWGPSEPGSLHISMHTTEVVIASNGEGAGFLDPATGSWTRVPTLHRGVYASCATDDTTLIVCMQQVGDLVAVPLDGSFTTAVVLPGTRDFMPTAVMSGWVFLNGPGDGEPAFSAMDAAGNTVEVPGLLDSADENLAAFYTGGAWGLSFDSISVYEVDS